MAVLYQNSIAIYDDSFQPTGTIHWNGFTPHIEMKKLRHELTLTVDGPDNLAGAVQQCVQQGAIAAAISVIAASFIGAGVGATGPAWAAFQAAFVNCAGNQVQARLDDNSHWITWDT